MVLGINGPLPFSSSECLEEDGQILYHDYKRRGDFMEPKGTESGLIHSFKKH